MLGGVPAELETCLEIEPRSISILDSGPYHSWCSGAHNVHSHQVLEGCARAPGSLLGASQTHVTQASREQRASRLVGAKGLPFFQSWRNGLTCCKTLDKSLLSAISVVKEVSGVISVNPAHTMVLAGTEFLLPEL